MEMPEGFQVVIPGQPAADVFGLWQAKDGEVGDLFKYAGNGVIGSIWSIDLAEDDMEAASQLETQKISLREVQQSLSRAKTQLDQEIAATKQSGGASFDLAGELRVDMTQFEQVSHLISQFASQVQQTVDQDALIQTTRAGKPLGSTRVSWSGDLNTWWPAGASSTDMKCHLSAVEQALITRQEWQHFLVLVLSGAVSIAASLATAPFSPLALWTIWNYIHRVVGEYSQLRFHVQQTVNS